MKNMTYGYAVLMLRVMRLDVESADVRIEEGSRDNRQVTRCHDGSTQTDRAGRTIRTGVECA